MAGGLQKSFDYPTTLSSEQCKKKSERRLKDPVTGEIYLWDDDAQTSVPVLPSRYLRQRAWKLCVHVTDRGSIVNSAIGSLLNMGYLFLPVFGFFHSQWNSVKRAAKRTQGGVIWRGVTQPQLVYKINGGPFGSQAWFTQKESISNSSASRMTRPATSFRRFCRSSAL